MQDFKDHFVSFVTCDKCHNNKCTHTMTGLIIFWFPLERRKLSFHLRSRLYEENLMFRRLGSSSIHVKSTMDRLQRVQECAARFVSG